MEKPDLLSKAEKIMTLVESERSEARNVSGIIPEAKRSGIVKAHWNLLDELSQNGVNGGEYLKKYERNDVRSVAG